MNGVFVSWRVVVVGFDGVHRVLSRWVSYADAVDLANTIGQGAYLEHTGRPAR